MADPIALRVLDAKGVAAHRIRIDPTAGAVLAKRAKPNNPAVLVTKAAGLVGHMAAGVLDPDDVVAVIDGDWSNAILIIAPATPTPETQNYEPKYGDAGFLREISKVAPDLLDLATATIKAIRDAGVDGRLHDEGGRWVNRPINSFTLKAQPRAGNIHFTLYGNPDSYDAGEFLRKDQNSYSRGWVKEPGDIALLTMLVRQSHERRRR